MSFETDGALQIGVAALCGAAIAENKNFKPFFRSEDTTGPVGCQTCVVSGRNRSIIGLLRDWVRQVLGNDGVLGLPDGLYRANGA